MLHCQVDGIPPITTQWRHNGLLVTQDHHHITFLNGSLLTRYFLKTKPDNSSDEGDYECMAQNAFGLVVSRKARIQAASKSLPLSIKSAVVTVEGACIPAFIPPFQTQLREYNRYNNTGLFACALDMWTMLCQRLWGAGWHKRQLQWSELNCCTDHQSVADLYFHILSPFVSLRTMFFFAELDVCVLVKWVMRFLWCRVKLQPDVQNCNFTALWFGCLGGPSLLIKYNCPEITPLLC